MPLKSPNWIAGVLLAAYGTTKVVPLPNLRESEFFRTLLHGGFEQVAIIFFFVRVTAQGFRQVLGQLLGLLADFGNGRGFPELAFPGWSKGKERKGRPSFVVDQGALGIDVEP